MRMVVVSASRRNFLNADGQMQNTFCTVESVEVAMQAIRKYRAFMRRRRQSPRTMFVKSESDFAWSGYVA